MIMAMGKELFDSLKRFQDLKLSYEQPASEREGYSTESAQR